MPPRQFPPVRTSPPREISPEPSSDSEDGTPAPVVASPIKRRTARGSTVPIHKLSDHDAWGYTDAQIIEAAILHWRSDVYSHFTITLRREPGPQDTPGVLSFVFTCKFGYDDHKSSTRLRMKTSEGTSNLHKGVNICLKTSGELGISEPGVKAGNQPLLVGFTRYSPSAHRAIIALRCAKNFCPFNMVTDDDYIREVFMLRPYTPVPDPSTVSRDIKHIYTQMSIHVKDYFMKIDGPIHLALDGWTSPLIFSYLGLVIIWYVDGEIHRSILKFIRLKSKHDGKYLAKVVFECLVRFGLGEKLFSICMDNASNCDKLVEELPKLLPSFPGMQRRLRCVPHILNLVAKIFISFFFKKPRPRQRVCIAKGKSNAPYRRPGESQDELGDEEEVIIDSGDDTNTNEDEAVLEEAEIDEENDEGDEGQTVHDNNVAKTFKAKAIQMMAQKGIHIQPTDEAAAQLIFPRISTLSRRIHDSPTINEKFQKMIDESTNPDIKGGRRSLTRRVPTRWNSDLACLSSHFHFREILEDLTAIPSMGLKSLRLTDQQWEIADDIHEVLLLFKDPTDLFSKAHVPLVVDVIPMLEVIREGLIAARDDAMHDVPNVVRVAAQASILVIDKYSTFAADCSVYIIALVLCPDRKLKWFKDHGRPTRVIKAIEKLVINAWKANYAGDENESSVGHSQSQTKRSRYAPTLPTETYPLDHVEYYLKESLASASDIKAAGGYIRYWTNLQETRPRLARMALDYCSAPASSVDAERAFSSGRQQVNFMQHNMSSQTFKAQMAVGSWAQSPLYPGLDAVTTMISKQVIPDEAENPFI